MNKLLRIFVAALIALTCIFGCDWGAKTQMLPTRAQCIAGAQIVWPESMSEVEITEQINSIANIVESLRPEYVAAVGYQDGEAIYAIFESHCEEKDSRFAELMDDLSDAVTESISFIPIGEEIQPSPETILVYGESWLDGQLLDGKTK